MSRLRKCPFCGEEVEMRFPYFHYHEGMDRWVIYHACGCDKNFEDGLSVFITGKTEEKVIDYWNGVNHEVEESESL